MSDDGSQKDDVKVPEGDVGDKIKKLFHDDGKDTSKPPTFNFSNNGAIDIFSQTSSFWRPWVKNRLSMPKRLRKDKQATYHTYVIF